MDRGTWHVLLMVERVKGTQRKRIFLKAALSHPPSGNPCDAKTELG